MVFDYVDKFNEYLIPLEGKEIEVIVRRRKKGRTNPQNAWYWSCVVGLAAEHFGYTPDEMHEAYKFMFLQRKEQDKPITVKSTTSLSTVEFTEYVEKCRQFCAEEGIVIPDPGDIELDNTEVHISPPVSPETLTDLFGWVGKGSIDEAKIIKLSMENFNKEPRFLTQKECEELDTIIISELNQ